MISVNKCSYGIFRGCTLLLLVFSLLACAIIASRFDQTKHAIVAGSMRFEQPQDLDILQVQVVVRDKSALLADAISLYLDQNETLVYQAILAAGDYQITAVRVNTGSISYESVVTPLPITFSLQPGETVTLGQLEIILTSKQGVFGYRVLEPTISLVSKLGDSKVYTQAIATRFPALPSMPVRRVQLVKRPISVEMQRKGTDGNKLKGNKLFDF